MHRTILALLCVLVAALMVVPTPQALAAKKKKASPPTLIYVNDGGQQIFAFVLNSDNTLTELDDSPFSTGAGDASQCSNNCESIIFSQERNLLFAGTADGIAVFNVASDGSLSPVPGSRFIDDIEIGGVAETSTKNKGVVVYAADPVNDLIHAFRLNNTNGALIELDKSPFDTGSLPQGLTIADGMLFVANAGDGTVGAYKIDGDGNLTEGPGSPFDVTGDSIQAVFSRQDDKKAGSVYVGEFDDDDIFSYSADKKRNPILKAIIDSPTNSDLTDAAGGVPINGKIGVAIEAGTDVQVFTSKTSKKSTGKLLVALGNAQDSDLASLAVGTLTRGGGVLILVDSDNDTVASYTIDSRTGEITQVDSITTSSSFDNDANGIVVTKN